MGVRNFLEGRMRRPSRRSAGVFRTGDDNLDMGFLDRCRGGVLLFHASNRCVFRPRIGRWFVLVLLSTV